MESQFKQAQLICLRLLAATPKSRTELSRRLKEKGFDEAVILEALDDLEKKGFLSDKAFAQNLLAKFTASKPSGSKKIEFELKRHGISPKLRTEILEGLTPESELERAREVALPRWQRFASLPAEKRKKRLYDFLARQGFDFQVCRDLIEEFENKNA